MPSNSAQNQNLRLAESRLVVATAEPRLCELLFEFVDEKQRLYRCELLDAGDWGVEAHITADDRGYFAARRCASREQAEQWGRLRQRTIEGTGSR
jgi:hypothetical protein